MLRDEAGISVTISALVWNIHLVVCYQLIYGQDRKVENMYILLNRAVDPECMKWYNTIIV